MGAVNPKRRKAVWLSFCHGIGVSSLCAARLQLPVVVHPVELDTACRQLTAQLYPRLEQQVGSCDVEQWADSLGEQLRSAVDLLIVGFPCQDVSFANKKGRLGLKGDKSGLFYRIGEVLEQLKALHSETHFV